MYSLSPRSEDEQVAHDVLNGLRADVPKPEAVLLVLDSTNMGRHLMLAAPILALGLPTLVILNMADDLRNRGGRIDLKKLAAELGAPVALVSARRGEGIGQVFDFLAGAMPKPRPRTSRSAGCPQVPRVGRACGQPGSVSRTGSAQMDPPPGWRFSPSDLGPLLFLTVVVAIFQTIFTVAAPTQTAVDWLIRHSGNWVASILPAGLLKSLIIDGIWKGVGSVIVFLPQILLLFLFIGILEDSGYLARAALIADRTMAKVGLQGKSFIPLLSAHACAVPAIMSTRTIENKRDRIATILIAPFMTCSARLPVYLLIIGAFIPNRPLLGRFLLPARWRCSAFTFSGS